jgi:hypothetical protein
MESEFDKNKKMMMCKECKIPMNFIESGSDFIDSPELKYSQIDQFKNYKFDPEKGDYMFQCPKCLMGRGILSHFCTWCDRVPDERNIFDHLLHVHGFDIKQWREIHGGPPKTNEDFKNDIEKLR